jgi:hypothetical protein
MACMANDAELGIGAELGGVSSLPENGDRSIHLYFLVLWRLIRLSHLFSPYCLPL